MNESGMENKIPKGYEKVTTGLVEDADQYLELSTMTWRDVEEDDIGEEIANFSLLIRKKK